MKFQKTHTIDDVVEAQNRVIRHLLDFMERNGRAANSRKGKNGVLVYGSRHVENELRRVFHFDERMCLQCRQWLPAKAFYRHPTGKAGLQARCRECIKENWVLRNKRVPISYKPNRKPRLKANQTPA